MFIPRGTILHENLATSYVLVDSLIADLCEGGFSGMVEVILRRADAHIVMVRGQIGTVVVARSGVHEPGPGAGGDAALPTALDYSRTTVSEIAAAARLERGRVSIYHYAPEIAEIIAGPATAETLYKQLSTEFADLEKIVHKLRRERERQWFIEVTTASSLCALVHMNADRCLVLSAREDRLREPCESADPMTNRDLRGLFDEARLMGGLFDVSFRGADEPLAIGLAPPESEITAESPEEIEPLVEGVGDVGTSSGVAREPRLDQAVHSDISPMAAEAGTRPAPPADVAEAVKEAKAVFDSLSLEEGAHAGPTAVSEPGAEAASARGALVAGSALTALSQLKGPPEAHLTEIPEDRRTLIVDAEPPAAEALAASVAEGQTPLISGPHLPVVSDAGTRQSGRHDSSPHSLEDRPAEAGIDSIASTHEPIEAVGDAAHVQEPLAETWPEPASSTPVETTSPAVLAAAEHEHSPKLPPGRYARRLSTDDLMLLPEDLRATGLLKRGSSADVLAEIKRLMSEMLRAVEESIRAAGERESFAMRLRAGLLTVAERFPFLDPFAGEFEYLAGEIVFIGEASAEDFIYGLGEALAQAIDIAALGSVQPARVRSHVEEGLQWLLNRQRADLEAYNLDHCIDAILSDIRSREEPAAGG